MMKVKSGQAPRLRYRFLWRIMYSVIVPAMDWLISKLLTPEEIEEMERNLSQ